MKHSRSPGLRSRPGEVASEARRRGAANVGRRPQHVVLAKRGVERFPWQAPARRTTRHQSDRSDMSDSVRLERHPIGDS